MTRIERSIEIAAPVEEVFDFVADWRNKSNWYVGVLDWRPTTEQTRGVGARFVFKTKFMGMHPETEMETRAFVDNQNIEYVSIRGTDLKRQVLFVSLDNRTRVTDISEYKLPMSLLGDLIDALSFRRRQERRAEESLQNLKRLTEH
jgi:uncharacterized membrane protein